MAIRFDRFMRGRPAARRRRRVEVDAIEQLIEQLIEHALSDRKRRRAHRYRRVAKGAGVEALLDYAHRAAVEEHHLVAVRVSIWAHAGAGSSTRMDRICASAGANSES